MSNNAELTESKINLFFIQNTKKKDTNTKIWDVFGPSVELEKRNDNFPQNQLINLAFIRYKNHVKAQGEAAR